MSVRVKIKAFHQTCDMLVLKSVSIILWCKAYELSHN